MKTVLKVDASAPAEEQEPEPLRRPVPPAPEYPLAALGDILGPAAQRIADTIQAPAAICGQSLLAAASLAVQPHADVLIDGRREPLSLWCISIADPVSASLLRTIWRSSRIALRAANADQYRRD